MVKILSRDPGKPDPSPEESAPEGASAAAGEAGVSLETLKPGQAGTVIAIEADPALKLHLMELGFVAGSPIAFFMSTPFGDPNIYALRGTSIALRKSEAKCIRVRI